MSDTREHIIRTTAALLEMQGYAATGISEIIAHSGAPRGSLYYYFPGGKEELVGEAIRLSGRDLAAHIGREMAAEADPAAAIFAFISRVGEHVVASDGRSGAPIAAVTLETAATSPRLAAACREAYGEIRAALAAALTDRGIAVERSAEMATLIIASLEGGIILCRSERSAEPLELVARFVRDVVARASVTASA